jgi:hypothetical protein
MSAAEQAAAAFAPPPAGTPLEVRLHRLEESLQAVVMMLAATTDAHSQRAAADPQPVRRRRHLYLVEN